MNCKKNPTQLAMTILVFLLILFTMPASALTEETYRYEGMWPVLPQLWYIGEPVGIAVDDVGNIYVTGYANGSIYKFNSKGMFVTKWAGKGSGPGKFSNIALDEDSNVYVTDSLNSCVQKFTSDGDFIRIWGSIGEENNQFETPTGIAVTHGYVYVADSNNDRIQKFTLDGKFIKEWGKEGNADGDFLFPMGITADAQGNIYVVDAGNHRIQKFRSDGRFLSKWGKEGSGEGEFEFGVHKYEQTVANIINDLYPKGIAIDKDGNLYVSDSNNHRVQKFDMEGNYLAKWGTAGAEDGEFDMLAGLAVDEAGCILTVELINQRIQKFDSDGGFITKYGNSGSGKGEFVGPMGIAVDEDKNVYVADRLNRIQKFNSAGRFVKEWGSLGSGDDQLNSPSGMDTDREGNLYVADMMNHRIQKFSPDGEPLARWGSEGSGDEEFNGPMDVAVDSQGNIYVADMGNSRIKNFNSDGKFLKSWGGLGCEPGKFILITGIATDEEGYIYVSEMLNRRIQKFTSDGEFKDEWEIGDSFFGSLLCVMVPYFIETTFDGADPNTLGFYDLLIALVSMDTDDSVLGGLLGGTDTGDFGLGELFGDTGGFDLGGLLGGTDTGDFGLGELFGDTGGLDLGGLLGGTDTGNSGLGGLFGDTGGLDLGGLLGGTDSEDSGLGGLFSGLFGSISTRDSGLGGFDITSIDDLEAICDILTLLEILGTDTSTLRLLCDVLTILKDMDLDDCLNLEAMNLSTGTNDLLNNITTCLVESDNVSSVIGTIGGVATDKKGNVYVAEGLGWIYKFTSDGKHITKIGEHGSGPGMLISPSHIDVDTDGKVYVTDSMNSRVQIFRPGPPSGRRQRAIIVAGKKSQSEEGDELWKYGITQAHANSVYNALTYQGYTYETICYLTPDTDLDLDENAETDDVDEEPTLENLENALTNWASDADDVVLYLVGHGEKEGLFHINPDEKLEASSLKLWLDELRQKLPSEGKITVVYEACYAGSFLSPLALENDTGKERSGDITRILITSGSDEVVEYSGNESFSFSYHFWTHVFKGQDIKDAFEQASDVVDETPLLDGNSNGRGNEDEDYISVQNTFIGSGLRIDLRDRHPLRRRVILMAGDLQKDEQEDNLWPVIESNMKSTYDALRFQEYSDDNIYLMSPYSISDVSANIRKPSLDNLEDAITRWAKEHTYDLVLYLTGIGEKNGCFRINEMESLSAETLDEWLDTLQEELPSPVIVICDADYSGSFLPVLLPPENKRRLLIASAPPDQPAYFDSQENISFSSFFWRNISYGMNLKESFVTTLGSLNALDAAPQLEADGNGIANEKDVDAESARRYTIGTGIKVTRETPSDRYEDDDELGQAAAIDVGGTYPQIRNFYHAGDTDWIKFHALPENSYRIEATDLGEKCDVVMELYNSDDTDNYLFQQDNQLYSTADETRDWECDKEGFYYVKLYHADPQASGQDTTYYFSISKVPTGGGEGNIEGRVTDVCSGKLIQGAVVKTSANSASGISDDEGYYVIADHSAAETFKLLASAEEYENYESEAAIPLAEDETLMNQNIAMFPVISRIIKGDINYDNRINLTDAILALQISGETESSQSLCMFADVNEDNRIGLEEVIYILNILTDE